MDKLPMAMPNGHAALGGVRVRMPIDFERAFTSLTKIATTSQRFIR